MRNEILSMPKVNETEEGLPIVKFIALKHMDNSAKSNLELIKSKVEFAQSRLAERMKMEMELEQFQEKIEGKGYLIYEIVAPIARVKKYLAISIIKKALESKEREEGKHNPVYNKVHNELKCKIKHFSKQIRASVVHLNRMKITPDQIMKNNLFPPCEYFRPKSKKLIEAIKKGDTKTVIDIIEEDRFTLYDYDPTNQTALHWAAKRNRPEMLKYFIDIGCYIDCKDS
jgi:hypothetical protein